MRTLMIRSLQVVLVLAVVAVGYYSYRAQRDAPATAATLDEALAELAR